MMNKISEESKVQSAGHLLKEARLAQSLTLEGVSKQLRINTRYLIHLEEDQENFTFDVYTLGFLRSYAKYLNLDDDDIILKFKAQMGSLLPTHVPFPAPLPGKGMPSFRILVLSFLALVVFSMGWHWYGSNPLSSLHKKKEWVEAIPGLPMQSQPLFPSQDLILASESLPAVSTVNEDHQLLEQYLSKVDTFANHPPVILKALEETWVEVKDKEGNIILQRLFKPGEIHEFKTPENLFLKAGNVRGVSLIYGEKTHTFLKSPGGVVRSHISLDPKKWVEESSERQ